MELFETTGSVELAEILFEGARSKGCGVVQFAQIAEAETAIGEFLSKSSSYPDADTISNYSQIPKLHVWRPPTRRALQRPLAHVLADVREGRAGDPDGD